MNLTNYKEIQMLLARHGFHFSHSLGQNFLIADWVPCRIADSAGLDRETGVLEIGPGIGCLTAELCRRAGKVLAVELDGTLKPVLAETLEGTENVELLFGDILKQNIPALIHEKLPGLRPVVCANLPYNVTSPILTALLGPGCFESITVMIQREVAKRLCALPATPEYGAFSLFVQWHSVPELLFEVPPGCFVPQPKVTSAVVRLTRREAPPVEVEDEEMLFRVIRAAFNQRRKTLTNALSSALSLPREQTERIIRAAGLDPTRRGETLDIVAFATIANELYKDISSDL